ncbi:nucleotidyltransferase family protein [Pedococcus sp. 5OH_020]|uniref:nucleotidyltransferase family protein n=1 Tax=Pedococcus sp. 5OH_020 TaxID=2989814 RepID=UPI0022E9AE4A|nr:nucleotidyltransferase family protein [Pedococcus sp. 5OH_020]
MTEGPSPSAVPVAGLLLAAGAGRRMGSPKALLAGPDGLSYAARGIRVLREAGCRPVIVVLGASAAEAAAATTEADRVVVAHEWRSGQSASLRAGLEAAAQSDAEAVVVLLVDLPDVGADVVRRVAQSAVGAPAGLARAAYLGVPGHPVLLGREHWQGVLAAAEGDSGARDYLARHPHELVECADLATGRDVDTPADLA